MNDVLKKQVDKNKEQDLLARKIVDILREQLTEEELQQATNSFAFWMAVQAFYSPSGAVKMAHWASVNFCNR
ncbi:hypothetical protein ACN09C_18125 [Serratia fonticola]|uniref:hypothetical protein n=1 Tax=Serratia fonticola TaxID=47917 RepID=UPI003AFF9980